MRLFEFVLAVVVTFSSFCCAPALRAPEVPAPAVPDMSRVLVLTGSDGYASACPILPGVLLTAKHVALDDLGNGQRRPAGYRTSYKGKEGLALYRAHFETEDLAVMNTDLLEVEPYPVSTTPAQVGDVIYLNEYVRSPKKGEPIFSRTYVKTTVNNIVGSHIFLNDFSQPMTSGSCVFNEKGEVVGILVAYWGVRDMKRTYLTDPKIYGVVVSIVPPPVETPVEGWRDWWKR